MVEYPYPRPLVNVDVVLVTLKEDAAGVPRLAVVLTAREFAPFQGDLALPGAQVRVDRDRDLLDVAKRLLKEKCGLEGVFIEQLATYGGAGRDPRDWSVSVAHYALVEPGRLVDHPDTAVVAVAGLNGLPFDHDAILAAAVERVRGKSTYTSLPFELLDDTFTLPRAKAAYEAATGRTLNDSWFRKALSQMRTADGDPYVVATGQQVATSTRPAALYRRGAPGQIRFAQRF